MLHELMLMRTDRAMVIVGAELSDVSLVDFDRHLIRDFSPGTRAHTAAAAAAAAAACHISAFVCLILNRYGTNMKKVVVCTELIYPLLYCVNEILYRVQRQALILLHSHCSAFFRTYVHSTYAYYAAPDRGAEYCDDRVCLCSSVCLSTSISPELHVRSSPNFWACYLCLWQSLSGDVAICYVLPVLWMTSCLYTMARNRRCSSDSIGSGMDVSPYTQTDPPGAAPDRGRSLMPMIALLGSVILTVGKNPSLEVALTLATFLVKKILAGFHLVQFWHALWLVFDCALAGFLKFIVYFQSNKAVFIRVICDITAPQIINFGVTSAPISRSIAYCPYPVRYTRPTVSSQSTDH